MTAAALIGEEGLLTLCGSIYGAFFKKSDKPASAEGAPPPAAGS